MTGIERLREFGGAVSRDVRLYDVTSRDYDEREGLSAEHDGGLLGEIVEDIADQIERETQPKSDPAADVSMSAYDLLPPDERGAIAWVRERGGLDAVKARWDGYVPAEWLEKAKSSYQRKRDNLKAHAWELERKCAERRERIRELERNLAKSASDQLKADSALYDLSREVRDVCKAHGIDPGEDPLGALDDALDSRLMPEGMEWVVEAWPRFEAGEPVKLGEEAMGFTHKPPFVVDHITIFAGGEATVCAEADPVSGKVENFVRTLPGKRVKRPAKVLDAYGVETRKGDTVYLLPGEWCDEYPLVECAAGCEMEVLETRDVDHDVAGVIKCLNKTPGVRWSICYPLPSQLTHERPERKCRDCAHWQKDPTADSMGVCWFYYHEHEGRDCYAARRADIGACEEFMQDGES